LAWQIDYTRQAQRQLAKLDKAAARQILDYMDQHVAPQTDPRVLGKALTGPQLGNYWRYRAGNYRVICDIQDGVLFARSRTEFQRIGKRSLCEHHFAALEVQDAKRPTVQPIFTMLPWEFSPLLEQSQTL
jgi:mRNA interferase RelE/StbE